MIPRRTCINNVYPDVSLNTSELVHYAIRQARLELVEALDNIDALRHDYVHDNADTSEIDGDVGLIEGIIVLLDKLKENWNNPVMGETYDKAR